MSAYLRISVLDHLEDEIKGRKEKNLYHLEVNDMLVSGWAVPSGNSLVRHHKAV